MWTVINRTQWRRLAANIREAAEASKLEHKDVDGDKQNTVEETSSEHPRGCRGVQVGAQGLGR